MNAFSDPSSLSAFEAAKALTQLVSLPSRAVSDEDSSFVCAAADVAKKATPPSVKKPEIFPLRLMNMLSDESVRESITWLPHGNSFVILRPDVFAESVLPAYFPESGGKAKYPSFTRKLNRWGFRQVNSGPDAGAFHHPLFRKDEPGLCAGMQCQKSGGRRSSGKRTAVEQHQASKRVEDDVSEAAAKPSPSRVPLKKRKLSHMPVPTITAVAPAAIASVSSLSSLASSSVSASSSVVSLSETPLLPSTRPMTLSSSHRMMPRRISSFTETAGPSHNQEWQVQQVQGHQSRGGGEGNAADFESTLKQLQASMEKARAAKALFSQAAQQPHRAPVVPIQPRPSVPAVEMQSPMASGKATTAAEEHKSMLYKAFLQAMQQ